jgi:DNA-binding NtrC family response regulator
MKRAVFVSRDKDQFVEVAQMLSRKDVIVELAGTGKDLLSLLSNPTEDTGVDLVVMAEELPDTAARPLVEAVITQSPFTHCVVAGTMGKKEFHDTYEGYGVLMQLPLRPDEKDAMALGTHLDQLAGLSC